MKEQIRFLVICLSSLFLCFLLVSSIKINFNLQKQDTTISEVQYKQTTKKIKLPVDFFEQQVVSLSNSIIVINCVLLLLLLNILTLIYLIKNCLHDPIDTLSSIAKKIDDPPYDLSDNEQTLLKDLSTKEGSIAVLSNTLQKLWLNSSILYKNHGVRMDEIDLFMTILSSHLVPTFLVSPDGLVKFHNNQADKLLKKLNISTDYQKTHLNHYMSDASSALELIKDQNRLPFKMSVKIANETIDLNATAVFDRDNVYIGAMVTWDLLTDEIDRQIILRRSAAISAASPVCTLTADLDGKIDFINQASLDKFEIIKDHLPVQIDQILGSFVDIFHSNPKHVNNIISDPENLPYESQILLGGETLQLDLSAIYDESNNYSGVLLHWSIVTKELEAKNKQLQQLLSDAQQASIAKSNFLSNMTHELRTPLNGIIGFTDLLLDDEINDDQRESLVIVQDCASGLLMLVNDLLDINRISAHQVDLEYKPISIEDIVYHCNDSIRAKAKDKNLELLISIADIKQDVLFDAFRLKQVINNLLSNAVKFTEKGEILTSVSIESETDTSIQLKFSVKDSGIGIPKENYSKILDRFEQGDGSVTRKFNGIGLGLPLCKRVLELMGSQLDFESVLDNGSVFSFVLDMQKNISSKLSKNKNHSYKTIMGTKVLIVKKSTASLNITMELCKSMGCEVFGASTTQGALEIIQTKSVDIIFMDLGFMDTNGVQLHQLVETLNQDIKLVGLTTKLQSEQVTPIHAEQFEAFLIKPLKKNVLYLTIKEMVNLKKIISESYE